ncbi:hypothetical protein [Desulfosediminicola flagellatus]|uniref:hypothetical protein n=1 Tax=Desulfosediminicola flagellatus TaxID=2569541 RepID=UPI0010AD4E0A|nr:hypothetical protein [Desulfosediminicola flagellatus]
MKLYFTCPKRQKVFGTSDYYLRDSYHINVSDTGEKKLIGQVSLKSACPLCGEFHTYNAEEVNCSYGQ